MLQRNAPDTARNSSGEAASDWERLRLTQNEFGSRREWLGLRELSNYADISEKTLRSWIYSSVDPLPAVKVSGKVLVRRTEFDAYLHRHRVKPLQEINIDAIVQDVLKGATSGR